MIRVKRQVRGHGPDWGPHASQLGYTCEARFSRQIWVGATGLSQGRLKGKIYVMDAERRTVEKELAAHADTVKTLCSAEDRYVLSGAGREEGKIAIWTVE